MVLQCGADSLTGDRLGCFNLTVAGHASCVEFIKSFGLPTLVLGGGGYTVRNVARCWTYETSVLLNTPIENDIPFNDFYEYYGPDFKLHLTPTTAENQNKAENLHNIVARVITNLKNLQGAPSVQMHPIPPDAVLHSAVSTVEQYDDQYPEKRLLYSVSKDGHGRKREAEAELATSGYDVGASKKGRSQDTGGQGSLTNSKNETEQSDESDSSYDKVTSNNLSNSESVSRSSDAMETADGVE